MIGPTPTPTPPNSGSRSVSVPVPPSVNNLWRAARTRSGKVRVFLSRRFKSWLEAAVPQMAAGLPRFSGPVVVRVTIRGGKGFPVNRDGDNVLKPLIDGLRKAGVIRGDTVRDVIESSVRYEPPGGPGAVAECVVEVRGA